MVLALLLITNACTYSSPFADLVVTPVNAAQHDAVLLALTDFASRAKLDRYPASAMPSSGNEPDDLRQQKQYTTYYLPAGSTARGFNLSVYEISGQCVVIRFSERARTWTDASRAALSTLEVSLKGAAAERVRLAKGPDDSLARVPGRPENYCLESAGLMIGSGAALFGDRKNDGSSGESVGVISSLERWL